MARLRFLLDTNIVVDYLSMRDPFYAKARLLMLLGRMGECELWMSASQITDLVYILSDGGKPSLVPSVLERLRGLRTFIEVYAAGAREVDGMLASGWRDPEDALLFESALALKADVIVSRNKRDFESSLVSVMDCDEVFDWLCDEHGLDYAEVPL